METFPIEESCTRILYSLLRLQNECYGPWYIPSKWVNGPDYLPTPGPT